MAHKQNGLIIIHIDGLSHASLLQAIEEGHVPFIKSLAAEAYGIQKYRCGIPSATPACQAGILYGDNSEIPSFRWYDKTEKIVVGFTKKATFDKVAYKYFKGKKGLIHNGATFGACFSGGAKETFGLGYHHHSGNMKSIGIILGFFTNPKFVLSWLYNGIQAVGMILWEYVTVLISGKPVERSYVFTDLLEEIFLHKLTHYAVATAMKHAYPVIYAGIYAYDETAHGFGTRHAFSRKILTHVDTTIRDIFKTASGNLTRNYSVLILSDHGQTETQPFRGKFGYSFGKYISSALPTYRIEENHQGKTTVMNDHGRGPIILTYCGGLADMYFAKIPGRMTRAAIEKQCPGLLESIISHPGIEAILLREGRQDILLTQQTEISLALPLRPKQEIYLRKFDTPAIVVKQLKKLNSFQLSGDIILFGKQQMGKQINFEEQIGGHGALGGNQALPFILGKKDWKIDLTHVTSSSEIFNVLTKVKQDLHIHE